MVAAARKTDWPPASSPRRAVRKRPAPREHYPLEFDPAVEVSLGSLADIQSMS